MNPGKTNKGPEQWQDDIRDEKSTDESSIWTGDRWDAFHSQTWCIQCDSDIGPLTIGSDGRVVTFIGLPNEARPLWATPIGKRTQPPRGWFTGKADVKEQRVMEFQLRMQAIDLIEQASRQLQEYLAGSREEFTLPLRAYGTSFQRVVWRELYAIPYGETRSYADIAQAIGCPTACRAVGGANHRNPLSIVIPCHRVIGQDGSLTGYGGGLKLKRRLLSLEQRVCGRREVAPDTPDPS